MRVLGLDVATRSGCAVLEGDRLLYAAAFRPPGEEEGEIFYGFRRWLSTLFSQFTPRHVAIEQPLRSDMTRTEVRTDLTFKSHKVKVPITNMQTLLRLYGLRAHAIEFCHEHKVPFTEINQREWRTAFLGVPGAPRGTSNPSKWLKDRALQQCRLRGYGVTASDAAEAVGVAVAVSAKLGIEQRVRRDDLLSFAGARA